MHTLKIYKPEDLPDALKLQRESSDEQIVIELYGDELDAFDYSF